MKQIYMTDVLSWKLAAEIRKEAAAEGVLLPVISKWWIMTAVETLNKQLATEEDE